MTGVWTVKAILDWCVGYLEKNGDPNPRLSAQWLLSEALGLSRLELYVSLDKPLTTEERATMREWVRRRAQGEPLQLICGKAPFRYLTVAVQKGVLIPRPETEVLVSEALEELALPRVAKHVVIKDESEVVEASEEHPIFVLDLCTGSGCIACALASEYPSAHVIASDISPEACELTLKNRDAFGLQEKIEVVQNDLMSGMRDTYSASFDLIISNPPYIPSEVLSSLDREVLDFEPSLALDGGNDGLDLFRACLDDVWTCLKPDGVFAVELFEDSLEQASLLAKEKGFDRVRIAQDLTGRNRVLIARRPTITHNKS